jgi:hypothetical protein
MKPAPTRRYSLYIHLSVLFSTLVLAAGAAIAWLGYVGSRDVALAAADNMFDRVGRETQSNLRDTLQPVANHAELLALEPLARASSLAARLEALPVMRLGFAGEAPVAASYVGYDDGSFFLLRQLPDERARAFFNAPAGSAYLVQSVEVASDGARRASYLFFDAALREIEPRAPAPLEFDPRTRPWYRLATEPGRRVLTDPYAFFTTESAGMTVAIRTPWGSVAGVDVTFDEVSRRLAALRALPRMKIALFDSERRLLARADVARTMVRREGDRVLLATLDELGDPVLAVLEPALAGATPAGRTVTAGGEQWKTIVLPMQTVRGTLSLGIAAPLDALLEGARAIRLRGLFATLIVLALAIPLTTWLARRVAATLKRITREAEDIRAFRFDGPSAAHLAFVEALSGTAAVAIETQRLLEARKALLDAFIRLVAGAVDAKSHYTGGHCERVPELTLMLAHAACEAKDGPYRDFNLSDEDWEAVQIASWLHDCGKVTTPEYVVDKATRLETIYDRIHEVRMRFEVLKRDAEIAYWKRISEGGDRTAAAAALERELATLDEEFAFVAGCNDGEPVRGSTEGRAAARDWPPHMAAHARRPHRHLARGDGAQRPHTGAGAAGRRAAPRRQAGAGYRTRARRRHTRGQSVGFQAAGARAPVQPRRAPQPHDRARHAHRGGALRHQPPHRANDHHALAAALPEAPEERAGDRRRPS